MNFANPQAWHLLWLLPLIAAGLHLFYTHRCKKTSLFIQEHLHQELAQGFSKTHYRIKAILIMSAFVLIVIALSRPQWGFTQRPVKRHGLDIMVVVDVSKSMLTQDVLPSRLERTKLAIKDLVMKLNGSDHIGLIAFAGDAQVMCPLTYDYNGFLLSLDDLGVDSIPRGGTDISQAIDEAIHAYQSMPDSDKAVVLVTDGEDEEGDALKAARRAKEKGVRIFTVGVGTRAGDLIQVTDANGQNEFLKDADGNVVKSRLNENLLQQIAYITGGAYIRSGSEQFGLDYLYDKQLSKLKKHDAEVKMAKLYDERFQWPLTLAFGLIFLEAVFLNKRRNFLFFIILFFITFIPSHAFASVAGDVNKANGLYKQGKFNDSLELYQKALDRDGKSPVIKYDLGTALYKKGDYDKALGYLEQASEDENIKIKPKAEYNLGNVLYKSGIQKENTNVDGAINSLQEALSHYGKSVSLDPKDQDAVYNQEFVKKVIERLKEQKKQQQQQNQQNQNKKQEKQKDAVSASGGIPPKAGQTQQTQADQKKQQEQRPQENKQNQQSQKEQEAKQDKQKEQQNQQAQQENQKNKEPAAENKNNKQENAQDTAEQNQKELDRKQAEDFLEEYRENEEPKKLLNYMPKKIDDRPVLKDW